VQAVGTISAAPPPEQDGQGRQRTDPGAGREHVQGQHGDRRRGLRSGMAAERLARGQRHDRTPEGNAAAAATADLAKEVTQLTKHIDELLGENRTELKQALTNLADTSRHLKETADSLSRNPSELIWHWLMSRF
jgi:hypothetical protein